MYHFQLTANSGLPKKTALMDFGIHAREWISPATGAYMINEVNAIMRMEKKSYPFVLLTVLNNICSRWRCEGHSGQLGIAYRPCS